MEHLDGQRDRSLFRGTVPCNVGQLAGVVLHRELLYAMGIKRQGGANCQVYTIQDYPCCRSGYMQ